MHISGYVADPSVAGQRKRSNRVDLEPPLDKSLQQVTFLLDRRYVLQSKAAIL